ncbi:MAG TPA: hypothetical protein VFQ67_11265 [Allosphingosinicella sp.]|jgi:hypothetical protein|nr:hypothetical protein [Allosphingosinicella sp.]
MRKLIIAMTALAAASPAFAQPRYDPRDEDIVRRLPPPQEVERIGDSLGAATEALMDVDVGPIADALDPYHRRYRHGRRETLGDLAGRRDPYARERMRAEIGAVTVGLGAAVEQVAVMTPVLRRSLEDSIRRMEEAIARGRYSRPYDRDYRRPDRYDPRDDRDYDPRDDERYDPEDEPR